MTSAAKAATAGSITIFARMNSLTDESSAVTEFLKAVTAAGKGSRATNGPPPTPGFTRMSPC